MNIIEGANGAVTAVAKLIDFVKNNIAGHVSDMSMTNITKITRAEPITVVSQDCANLKDLSSIMHTLCSIYSGYFLQTVAVMTKLNNIEVVRLLDRLNPDRDATGFLLQGRQASFESIENYAHSLPIQKVLSAEDASRPSGGKDTSTEAGKMLYENQNLAVGKMLNVSISAMDKDDREHTVVIPVTVRLSPRVLNDESISLIFTHKKGESDIVERYHDMRAGKISGIKDMIFCEDLIREYRRAALKDTSGTLREIVRRANNARSYGVLTKNPSLAVCSNLYVISQDTANMIEAKVGQKFSSALGREKLFEGTYGMVIAVVNPEWEKVTFYINHVAAPATFKFRDLEVKGGKSPDIENIMKAVMEGRAPVF